MNGGRFSYNMARNMRSIWGKHGVRRCLRSVWVRRISGIQMRCENVYGMARQKRTLVLDLTLFAGFTFLAIGIAANKFEVFSNVVHLLLLYIGHDDIYIVAAVVVHSPENHEFR